MTTDAPVEQRVPLSRHALLVLLAAAAIARVVLAWNEVGIYWPDEIYQSLEMGHRLAFGYGIVPWEFIDGARNWTFPALIGVVMKIASWIGLDHPAGYLRLLRMLFAATGVLATWGAYRLARAYRVEVWSAIAGSCLFGLAAVPLYFAHRAMSETASAAPIVWGLVFLVEPVEATKATRWRILGACLLGLAVLIRLQAAIFCVGVVVLLIARRRNRDAFIAVVTLVVWAALLGVIDKLTWGGFFHSAIKYLQFNLIEGKAAGWGTAPFSYYARVLWLAMPGPSLVLVATLPFAVRRAPGVWLTALAFVMVHAWTPHKELRFIFPVLPVLAGLAACGIDEVAALLSQPVLRPMLSLASVVLCVHSAFTARSLTFGQLGAYEGSRDNASAWDDAGGVNRLLLRAHDEPQLCGLKIEAAHLAWTGGQSYLHRPVHLYSHVGPPRQLRFYNYVITRPEYAGGGEVVATDGPLALVRFPFTECASDPNYSDRLP